MSSQCAIFLDRDGTLIEDRGFLRKPSEVHLIPDVIESLRLLADRHLLFIVTNQTGVGEGALAMRDVDTVNRHLLGIFAASGVDIASVFVCPHKRTDDCACIKPKPYFLEKAARDYALDLSSSFVIGDHPHDVDLARNAGARGVYVLTGHGVKHQSELADDAVVVPGIKEAVEWICAMDAMNSRSGSAFLEAAHTKGDRANE